MFVSDLNRKLEQGCVWHRHGLWCGGNKCVSFMLRELIVISIRTYIYIHIYWNAGNRSCAPRYIFRSPVTRIIWISKMSHKQNPSPSTAQHNCHDKVYFRPHTHRHTLCARKLAFLIGTFFGVRIRIGPCLRKRLVG